MFSRRTMERVPPATAQNMNKTVGMIQDLMTGYGYSALNLTQKYEQDNRGALFSTSDCLLLAKQFQAVSGLHRLAREWLEVARDRLKTDKCFDDLEDMEALSCARAPRLSPTGRATSTAPWCAGCPTIETAA